jgi:hypothetical protein
MDDDVLLARQARDRAKAIADLNWNWDGLYDFGYDPLTQEYTALCTDTGAVLRAHTANELRNMVLADYREHQAVHPPLRLLD